MSTKVFLACLDEETINKIKLVSSQYKISIPKTLQTVFESEIFEKLIEDPCLEFAGQMPLDDDFENLINLKRLKSQQLRDLKKSNADV